MTTVPQEQGHNHFLFEARRWEGGAPYATDKDLPALRGGLP